MTLVFIHGSGDNRHIWRLQMQQFGKGQALALDLPGHGERADTLPAEVMIQDYAQAVHQIIKDELKLVHPMFLPPLDARPEFVLQYPKSFYI